MILIVKHISIEGPGTLGRYFDDHRIKYRILELADADKFPSSLEGINGVVILGGPMNVYEEQQYGFLEEENHFIQNVIGIEIPFLGVCLGSQLLAKAADAKVKRSPVTEHGFFLIDQTEDGKMDPLFEGIGDQLIGFQWHEDTFDIPQGGVLLSTSRPCRNQAMKVGKNSYGLQYHIEVDKETIESWIKKYFKVGDAAASEKGQEMLDQYEQLKVQFEDQARQICKNFHSIVKNFERERIVT